MTEQELEKMAQEAAILRYPITRGRGGLVTDLKSEEGKQALRMEFIATFVSGAHAAQRWIADSELTVDLSHELPCKDFIAGARWMLKQAREKSYAAELFAGEMVVNISDLESLFAEQPADSGSFSDHRDFIPPQDGGKEGKE